MTKLSQDQTINPRGSIIVVSILGIIGLMGIFYRYFVVPSEGYRYTVVLVVSDCSTLLRGDGYILRYSINGKTIETKCDPSELKLTSGNRYLVRYAKASPNYYSVLRFVLVDSIMAPPGGWEQAPMEHFKSIE